MNVPLPRFLHALVLLLLAAMLLLTLGAFAFHHWLQTPLGLDDDKVIIIEPGDTLGKVSYQLASDGLLSQPELFILYARLSQQTKIKVGEYRLQTDITPIKLLDQLGSGDVVSYQVTLVEGRNFKQFMETLGAEEKLQSSLKDKNFDEIKTQLGLTIDHPEGWFYPDTYRYVSGMTDVDILLQAHERMQAVLAEEWQQRSADLPYESPYDALIMASIVEKETGLASERGQIAGVFVRRLQKGMRLQTDPTVIYGLGDAYDGNIRRKHLRQPTPYNTYVIRGLPPTPIAMPAREAIHASLHPEPGKTLFFVAKGDGSHQFSETLEDHNRAVQKYQIKQRAKNYRSAPPPTSTPTNQ